MLLAVVDTFFLNNIEQNMAAVSHLTYCKTTNCKICEDLFTFAFYQYPSVRAVSVLIRPVGVAFIHLRIEV